MTDQDLANQYRTTELLRIRAETHRCYTEDPFDLDEECAKVLALEIGSSHLDVGCGPGVFLRYLRTHGHRGRLAGLDQSAAMIAEAREAAAALDEAVGVKEDAEGEAPGLEWFVGEAGALPFPAAAFTSISARHMLYHVPDIPTALREIGRVAEPHGTALRLTACAQERLNAMGGVCRDPKEVGIYVCRAASTSANSAGK